MKIIKKIGLKGIGPFTKGTTFEIPKGITYLYGKNQLDNGNGNAAGKSLFASTLPELLYDAPIVGTKQDKSKSGSRFVEYESGANTIKIISAYKGKSEKLEVLVNGKPQKFRGKTLTKDYLRKVWPITENEYKTYGYLDSRIPHPLVMGTSTERKNFFSSFFGLDKIDTEKKIISTKLSAIRKTKAAYEELKSNYNSLKEHLIPKDERIELESKLLKLRKRIKLLTESNEEASRVKRLIEFETYAANQIKAIYKLCPDLNDFQTLKKKLKARLAKAESEVEQLEDWKAYVRDMKVYKQKTQDLDMSLPLDKLESDSKAYTKLETELEYLDLTEPKEIKSVAKPKGDKKELIGKQSNLEHQIEHARKFKTGVCVTCGQSVKVLNLPKLKSELESVEEQINAWEEYDKYKAKKIRYDEELQEYEKQVVRIKEIKDKIKKLKPNHDLYNVRRKIIKPVKVEKPEDVEEPEPIKADLNILLFCEPHIDTILELKKLSSSQRELDFDPTELNTLQEKSSKISARLESHNTFGAQLKTIKERLEVLEEEAKQEQALELILNAYADKAIKKMVIESISQHLMSLVNKYAELIFTDYHFEFVWGTQIQILVHRPSGVSDVRKLSGAENKLFTLVLVLALMSFVPKSKRLSLLILDEPTASFSDQTTEMFHTLLPHLNTIIPSILVVTPDETERLESASEYTVLRSKEGAKIVKGHPDEI